MTEGRDLLFSLEAEPALCGAAAAPYGACCRDLAAEATIVDIRDAVDAASPPAGRGALRALRRLVGGLLPAGGGGDEDGDTAPGSPPRPGGGAAARQDGLSELAEALAEVLSGAGVAVAVRAPRPPRRARRDSGGGGSGGSGGDAAPAPPAARGRQSFVLRGAFLVVKGPYSGDHGGFYVDPSFRDLFRIAPATPGYERVVASLPRVFIGDAAALKRIVALMVAQAERSYSSQGLTAPPWRSRRAMLERWFPADFTDTPVTPPSSPLARLGSGEAAAAAAAAAREAAEGAVARLASAAAAAAPRGALAPARVVRGFEVGCS